MRTLVFSLLTVILLATGGLSWLFDRAYEDYHADPQATATDAVQVAEQLGQGLAATLDGQADRQAFVDRWHQPPYHLSLLSGQALQLPPALMDNLKQGQPLLLETSEDLAIHYYLPTSGELLVLKAPLARLAPGEHGAAMIFTLLFYLALMLLFLAWLAPLIRRLVILRKTAQAFGEGDLSQRLATGPLSYIRDIETEFNHMAQRIDYLVADVKLLSSAVSHDLRTPLARIRFGLDTLAEEEDPALRRRFEQKISRHVDDMTALVETLLRYARLDQAMLELDTGAVDLPSLLNDYLDTKVPVEINSHRQIAPSLPQLHGDRQYLSMLINNLLQNAVNYGRGEIAVSLDRSGNHLALTIEDNGEGIADARQAEIFKPFVRGERNPTGVAGHGIGLAIVKRIVDWHRGTIRVDRSPALGGARFTLLLPIDG